MKKKSGRMLVGVASLLLLLSSGAYADPFSYTYTGSWTSFSTGIFGPTYVATMVVDNGGNSAANQVFTQADFVSATLVSGGYNQTALPGDITGWVTNFSSDALGQLGGGWFDANPGGDGWHFDNDFQDENFFRSGAGQAGFFSSHFSNPGTALVPEPSALCLMALGLLSVGSLVRPRARRA